MASLIVSDAIYQALMDAAAQRGRSPEAIIAEGIQALGEQGEERLPTPLSAEEFEQQILGRSQEEAVAADAEARRRYPKTFA